MTKLLSCKPEVEYSENDPEIEEGSERKGNGEECGDSNGLLPRCPLSTTPVQENRPVREVVTEVLLRGKGKK